MTLYGSQMKDHRKIISQRFSRRSILYQGIWTGDFFE